MANTILETPLAIAAAEVNQMQVDGLVLELLERRQRVGGGAEGPIKLGGDTTSPLPIVDKRRLPSRTIGERDRAADATLDEAHHRATKLSDRFGTAIFPIDWPEPFGLVMIEAMACGTPVIAFRSGSTPEVIDDGVTDFLVASLHTSRRRPPAGLRPPEERDSLRGFFRRALAVHPSADHLQAIQSDGEAKWQRFTSYDQRRLTAKKSR
jgi:glycosyltransferase involved in cell wall biosynthesis